VGFGMMKMNLKIQFCKIAFRGIHCELKMLKKFINSNNKNSVNKKANVP